MNLTTSPPDAMQLAALRLREAERSRTPCDPVRDLIGESDEAAAYAVASHNVALRLAQGRVRVGRKIGLTSPAVQNQLGVDRPDYGSLLDDMRVEQGGVIPFGRLLQPKVEAEVAFVLARDIDGTWEHPADLAPAVAGVSAALEIVDSRIAAWNIRFVDTVADNASSGMFVLSDVVVPLTAVVLEDVQMSMTANGEPASQGSGDACLGSPLTALDWLARTALRLGDPLRAGEIVLSGALGPMVTAVPGDRFEASLSSLGTVAVQFADAP